MTNFLSSITTFVHFAHEQGNVGGEVGSNGQQIVDAAVDGIKLLHRAVGNHGNQMVNNGTGRGESGFVDGSLYFYEIVRPAVHPLCSKKYHENQLFELKTCNK